MSAPVVAVPETPVVEPTPVAGPAADASATPTPPADATAAAEAKATPETPAEPSEPLKKALGNVRGMARQLRALEKENAALRADQQKAAPAPGVPKTVDDELAALPTDKDAEGKELVKLGDEWMSPAMAREMLENRRLRQAFLKDRDERTQADAKANAEKRAATTQAAYSEMATGIETAIKQLMTDSFSAAPDARKPRVESFLIHVADDLIAAAGEEAKAEGKDPLEVLLQDGFLEGIAEQVRTEGVETFGAFAEAQLNDNREQAEKHPVTTPKGQPAVEPDMTYEKMRQLPPAERRKILDRIKQRHA